ncbi:MAG: peptidoglycan-binding protein [Marinobacter sp.]
MSHTRFTGTQGFIAIAMAVSFCAVAQAGPERTIFSAENALYGAGFDVGKADGWMDNALRSAIREYQSGHADLEMTGNLDSQTLSALGIAAADNGTIGGNAVSDRNAAMAAIGLEPERSESPSSTRSVATKSGPAPEPEQEVEPEPAPVAQPETDTSELAETIKEKTSREPTPEPEVAAPSEPAESPAVAEVTAQQAEPQPEPEVSDVAVVEKEKPAMQEEPAVEEETRSGPTESVALDEPSEPARVVRTSSDNTNETSTANNGTTHQSSGGFFSSIFDFLFGWLI